MRDPLAVRAEVGGGAEALGEVMAMSMVLYFTCLARTLSLPLGDCWAPVRSSLGRLWLISAACVSSVGWSLCLVISSGPHGRGSRLGRIEPALGRVVEP